MSHLSSINDLAAGTDRQGLAGQLIDASIDCMLALDAKGNIIFWNEACTQYTGLEARDVMGKALRKVFPAAFQGAAFAGLYRQVLKGYKLFLPAAKNEWLNGYFELHIVPLKDTDDAVNGILLIAHDVAHRVKTEQELNRLNTELATQYEAVKNAAAELAAFTSLTSQDLKNPLRKTYSLLERIAMEEGAVLSNKGRSNLRRAQAALQRLGLLADSLIAFSETEAIQPVPVLLDVVVQEAVSLLRPLLQERPATIEIDTLPIVPGDAQQLRMLFYQLLTALLPQCSEPRGVKIKAMPAAAGEQQYHRIALQCCCAAPNQFSLQTTGMALGRKIATSHGGRLSIDQPEENVLSLSVYLPLSKV